MTEATGTDPISSVVALDSRRRAVAVAMAFKVALALCFVVAIAVPLDHLEGKGMAFRFPLFMLSAVVVPLAWRGRFGPYPATADVLIVAPFLIDTLGNLAYVYDTFDATDDVLHAVNWILLVGAFHAWRYRRGGGANRLSRTDAWLLGTGLGALAIVGWEAAEWIVAETGAGGGLDLTYDDTVADLVLSTGGGMIGSVLAVTLFPSRPAGFIFENH
ncbi:hypothetical protein [Candidatus Poriferisodalis sp.]|uniref:hypothetical protein n=1 Tax=Candidatus Poriferisodalis sp. TaxID=3101277 RepID=UPI003C6F6028